MDRNIKIIDGIFNCIKDDLGLSFKNLILISDHNYIQLDLGKGIWNFKDRQIKVYIFGERLTQFFPGNDFNTINAFEFGNQTDILKK